MKLKNKSLLLVPALAFAVACGESGQDAETTTTSADDVATEAIESVENVDMEEEPDFLIPSALQISTIFQNSGLTYVEGLTNDPANVSNYVSKYSKMLNFGSYTADMFYSVLNDQSQMSIEYLRSIRQLSEETGMSSIFNTGPIFERFEQNIGDRDSVINIMLEFQEKTDIYIAENGEEHNAMTIFTGAWIEGMYIGFDGLQNKPTEELKGRLIEQMSILPNLIKGVDYQPNQTDESAKLKEHLVGIQTYFDGIEGLLNKEEYTMDLSVLTEENINELSSRIKEARKFVVGS
jgi:hypothetical protein